MTRPAVTVRAKADMIVKEMAENFMVIVDVQLVTIGLPL